MASAGDMWRTVSSQVSFVVKQIMGGMQHKPEAQPKSSGSTPEKWKLKLPPGLEQELPLN